MVTAKAADNTTTSVTTGYDSWGRQVSYQPQGDPVTTTVYDAAWSGRDRDRRQRQHPLHL